MTERERLLSYAKSQIGYGTGSKSNKYTAWCFGSSYEYEWCAAFVAYCFDMVGMSGYVLKTGYVPYMVSSCKAKCDWMQRGADVKAGDICFYDWNLNGLGDHVGIVTEVKGNTIKVAEGNSSQSPYYVYTRTVQKNWAYIMGFARPKYKEEQLNKDMVKALQGALNRSYDTKLAVDGIYGNKTYEAVKKYAVKLKSRGYYVKWLQCFLDKCGYECISSGIADIKTIEAVKKFQKDEAITADGIMGNETLMRVCLNYVPLEVGEYFERSKTLPLNVDRDNYERKSTGKNISDNRKKLKEALSLAFDLPLEINGIWDERTERLLKEHPVKMGDKNEIVLWVQKRLIAMGHLIEADSSFGEETYLELCKFQKKYNIKVSGIIDLATVKRLCRC